MKIGLYHNVIESSADFKFLPHTLKIEGDYLVADSRESGIDWRQSFVISTELFEELLEFDGVNIIEY